MVEAVEESIVDSFILKPSEDENDLNVYQRVNISGQIKGINKDFIFVEISETHLEYLKNNCHKKYNISFQLNLLTFQLQHNALKWIRNHNLFHILVNNPKYDVAIDDDRFRTFLDEHDYDPFQAFRDKPGHGDYDFR